MLVQLGLAEEHDLQQFRAAGFEVGEQPDLLQRFLRHGVGFVDQHHHAPVLAVEFDQVILQDAQQQRLAFVADFYFQLVGDGVEDFLARERGVGQQYGVDVPGQPLHQHPAQHGLAAAHLARHFDDALVVSDGVEQRLQRRAAVGAAEEKVGVRGDAKGRFVQAEVIEIHGVVYFLSGCSMREYRVVRLMPSIFAAWLTLPWVRRMAASI